MNYVWLIRLTNWWNILAIDMRCSFAVTCLILVFNYGQCATHVHNICQEKDQTYEGSVILKNNRLASSACDCSAQTETNMTVVVRLLLVVQSPQEPELPVKLSYRGVGGNNVINITDVISNSNDGDIVLASNIWDFSIETRRVNSSDTIVKFLFYVYTADHVRVTCSRHVNKTDDGSSSNNALDYIHSLCSSELIILLSSVIVALLLIILIVSVMLCCVMPRKQQMEIKKLRQSMLLENDVTLVAKGADRIRPETVIYDDATGIRKTVVLDPKPAAPAGHYANSTFRQSSLYQNV